MRPVGDAGREPEPANGVSLCGAMGSLKTGILAEEKRMSARRIILTVMLVAFGACAVAGVMAMLMGTGDMFGKILVAAIITAVATGLLLPLSLLTDRPKFRLGGLVAMAAIAVCWF